jgi:hypothetical protein
MKELEQSAQEIWSNEVKKEYNSLGNAIHELHQIDKSSGILNGNSDGLD